MIDTNYTRPNGGRGVSLISRLNARNPHYTNDGVAPTTAEMFNATHWLNDQLDKERIYAADKARKASQNPMIREIKMRTLLGAGYTQPEAARLASDPTFWRPEWERYGIERPYAVDMQVSGSSAIAQRNKRFAPTDDRLEIEDYIDQHRFERDLEQRKKQVEALPEVYARRGATSRTSTGSSGSATRRASGSGDDEQSALLEAANRERFIATGKPAFVKPSNRFNDYIGKQVSEQLYKSNTMRENADMAIQDAMKAEQAASDRLALAKSAAKTMLDKKAAQAAIAQATQKLRDAKAQADEVGQIYENANADYIATRKRAEGYGLDVDGHSVLDASTGRVSRFSPPATEEDYFASQSRTPVKPAYRLNDIQRNNINREMSDLEKTGAIDLESDYFNPIGARATAIAALRSGRGYKVSPVVGEPLYHEFEDGTKARIGNANTGRFEPTYGRDYFTVKQNRKAAAERILSHNPELTQGEADYLADQEARKQIKPYAAPRAIVQPATRYGEAPWDYGIDWDEINRQSAEDTRQHNFQTEDLIERARNRSGYDYTLGGY